MILKSPIEALYQPVGTAAETKMTLPCGTEVVRVVYGPIHYRLAEWSEIEVKTPNGWTDKVYVRPHKLLEVLL